MISLLLKHYLLDACISRIFTGLCGNFLNRGEVGVLLLYDNELCDWTVFIGDIMCNVVPIDGDLDVIDIRVDVLDMILIWYYSGGWRSRNLPGYCGCWVVSSVFFEKYYHHFRCDRSEVMAEVMRRIK